MRWDNSAGKPGLTLLEVLVAAAILVVTSYMVFTALSRGRHAALLGAQRAKWYQWARGQVERVRATPVSELPPERHVIPPVRPMIQLRHSPIVRGSTMVLTEDGDPLRSGPQIDHEAGTLVFSDQDARRAVVVAYAYRVEPAESEGLEDVWLEVYGEFVDEELEDAINRDTGIRRVRVTLQCQHHGAHYGERFEVLRAQ